MPCKIPLSLGPLGGDKLDVRRSRFFWLRKEGEPCQPGGVIGFCNIALFGELPDVPGHIMFEGEQDSLQAAMIAKVAGRLRDAPSSSSPGWLETAQSYSRWQADEVIASLEVEDEAQLEDGQAAASVRCFTRSPVSNLAEENGRLLGGWHDRSRAWDPSTGKPTGTLLGLGICELEAVLQGVDDTYGKLLDSVTGPAHAVNVWDVPLVHSARVIIEQINRTEEEVAALADDFLGMVREDPLSCSAADWIFAASCVRALRHSPATDRFDLLTRTGIETTQPADTVILSVNGEPMIQLRHRKLGYVFNCHKDRVRRLGKAAKQWLVGSFELEPKMIEDVKADYLELAALLRQSHPKRQILILNAMSTAGREEILSYDVFDPPLGRSLRNVRSQEINAMLDDLAHEANIAIVDADAIGAELGGGEAIPDGVHQSVEMRDELRKEILAILNARKVPGFTAYSP